MIYDDYDDLEENPDAARELWGAFLSSMRERAEDDEDAAEDFMRLVWS
jgi:hypothetical protein